MFSNFRKPGKVGSLTSQSTASSRLASNKSNETEGTLETGDFNISVNGHSNTREDVNHDYSNPITLSLPAASRSGSRKWFQTASPIRSSSNRNKGISQNNNKLQIDNNDSKRSFANNDTASNQIGDNDLTPTSTISNSERKPSKLSSFFKIRRNNANTRSATETRPPPNNKMIFFGKSMSTNGSYSQRQNDICEIPNISINVIDETELAPLSPLILRNSSICKSCVCRGSSTLTTDSTVDSSSVECSTCDQQGYPDLMSSEWETSDMSLSFQNECRLATHTRDEISITRAKRQSPKLSSSPETEMSDFESDYCNNYNSDGHDVNDVAINVGENNNIADVMKSTNTANAISDHDVVMVATSAAKTHKNARGEEVTVNEDKNKSDCKCQDGNNYRNVNVRSTNIPSKNHHQSESSDWLVRRIGGNVRSAVDANYDDEEIATAAAALTRRQQMAF